MIKHCFCKCEDRRDVSTQTHNHTCMLLITGHWVCHSLSFTLIDSICTALIRLINQGPRSVTERENVCVGESCRSGVSMRPDKFIKCVCVCMC